MFPQSSSHQTQNYFEVEGGSGGQGQGNGIGGAGGDGMGPGLSFDIWAGNLTMNNMLADNQTGGGLETGNRRNEGGRPSIHQNIHHYGAGGIDILHRAAALAAIHDSAESYPLPRCHPETRTEMLDDLRKWAMATDSESSILWLHGPAGAGKSAIMRTLASQLHDAGILGGCFFFKRGHATRGNGRTLFSTIAYQLALRIPWLRTPISQAVQNDPSIVARSIESQMRKLIYETCSPYANYGRLAILIDGLDECDDHGVQQKLLRAIRNSFSKHPIPLRFIVASRPEPQIREVFASPFYSGHYRSFNVEQSFEDVRKYLCDEFGRIHLEHHHTMANIPWPWPLPDVLEELVVRSSGHFIYASTIIKFIDDKSYRPTERLKVVQDTNSPGFDSAFDPLDQLYTTILSSAPRRSEFMPILYGETQLLLRGLHSVLQIPSDNHDSISSHHASFLDFLDNPNRSRNFTVGTSHHRIELARSLLKFCGGHLLEPKELCVVGLDVHCNLTPFIASLPVSAEVTELIPLIASINPDYIFDHEPTSFERGVESMLSWLREIPSPPHDVIRLWEDYKFIIHGLVHSGTSSYSCVDGAARLPPL
ncbi:NACHT domain-containing protein [Mycena sanguinolenta]|uniref:NACHT domain-containing protein n=1 Tax=Mycena sanguinolenta TaxID=230812 RepID=A0A8H6Y2I2_9AGAR|nr:NACHT domain-containing protein [Mycena sanguinolenta]